jgi:hypothetical protein
MHDKTTKKRSTICTNGEAGEFEANLNATKGNSLKLKKDEEFTRKWYGDLKRK